MYTPAPTEGQLAVSGLTAADFEAEVVDIWPEHFQAYRLFVSMQTQWRVGVSGPTGLDFEVAYRRMDRLGLTSDEYDDLDEDLQAMELAALAAMHERG